VIRRLHGLRRQLREVVFTQNDGVPIVPVTVSVAATISAT
jgi:hypothetical protein